MVSYNSVKFGDHRDSGRVDIMDFLCHVTLQNHMIKGSCDFMEEPIKISHHPHKFGCTRTIAVTIYRFLFVTLPCKTTHLIKSLYDFMVRSLSRYITVLPTLVVIATAVVKI